MCGRILGLSELIPEFSSALSSLITRPDTIQIRIAEESYRVLSATATKLEYGTHYLGSASCIGKHRGPHLTQSISRYNYKKIQC